MNTGAARAAARAPASAGSRPPVVLPMASYYGTLAAVRSLGAAGVPVTVADGHRLAPARWSRFAAEALPCPDVEREPDRFVAWLLALGERRGGHVLFATSDDVAWLLARHRAALSRRLVPYVPPLEAMAALLDKWRLHLACREVGLETPDAWLPDGDGDLLRLAREVPLPVMVKPRTQVLLLPHQKGRVVRSAAALPALYADLRAATRHAPTLLAEEPGLARPLVQAFAEGAATGILAVSGFVDATGELFVAVAARKLLQRPRLMGIGLCFEEAELAPRLAEGLRALCRRVGYHGPFEAEFVEPGGRPLLIDFNPRFYGQLAFDVARGLDLPRLAYLEAIGDRAALRAAVEDARRAAARRDGRVYCHRIQLEIFLALLRLTGRMSRADARRWRAWRAAAGALATDPFLDARDWKPAVVEAVSSVWQTAIHPRSALRSALER